MSAAVAPGTWGSCRYCGVAVPPGRPNCEICGAPDPLPAGAVAAAPKPVRRRLQLTSGLRAMIVVGVAIALAASIVQAELSGPPNVPDALTTSGVHAIPVGGQWVLAGNVTGGDYILGNFSTIDPAGLSLGLSVYNASAWLEFDAGKPVPAAYTVSPTPSGRIVFTADYTDKFYFDFWNPYATTSTLNVTAYIVTEYQSNVGDEGFG